MSEVPDPLEGELRGDGGGRSFPLNLGRGAKTILILAALMVVFKGIQEAKALVIPVLLAVFVASVTAPVVSYMRSKGVPSFLAVLLAVLLDIAALTGIGALVGSSLSLFYARLPEYQQEVAAMASGTSEWLAMSGVPEEEITKALGAISPISAVGWLLTSVAQAVSNFFLVLLIVIFMLAEYAGLKVKLTRILGVGESVQRWRRAASQVNKYLLVKTGTSALTGLMVGVWCWIFGLDMPALWGLLAFLLNYIPTLGAIIAGIPIVLLGAVQLDLGGALGLTIGYVVINGIIGFLEPRIFGRALGLSPLVVFLSMLLWYELLGPVGALFAVPLTMIIKIFLMNTNDFRWIATLLAPARKIAEDRMSYPPPPPRPRTPAADRAVDDSQPDAAE
ncbi:MAG: AI-2E family transporter [Myxococcota bacterium]